MLVFIENNAASSSTTLINLMPAGTGIHIESKAVSQIAQHLNSNDFSGVITYSLVRE